MKFGKEACMVGMGALVGLGAIRSSKADSSSIRGQQRRSLTTIGECVVAIADVQGVDEKDEFRVACETEEGNMYDVDGLSSDFVRSSVENGNLAPGDVIPSLNGKPVGLDGKIRSSSAAPGIEKRNEAANKRGRRLAIVEGDRTVLAVMVTTSDATYSQTKAQLEDDVFLDSVSLATQYFACSHGKLNFVKAANRDSILPLDDPRWTSISNGIVAITVAESSTDTDSVVRPAVTNELVRQFGTSASNLAHHVMYCLPPGTMSGIAYAYINSWNSVYSDLWCNYVSAQLHELGHNLNLAHSGETQTYDDQSGMMGYSYGSEDTPKMCFNNAKKFQLGWFDGAVVVLSSPANPSYIGPLKGQVNYDKLLGSNQDPVIIKINDPGSIDYYVGFNHRVKHNSGTVEGGNQVTIQRQGGEGSAYSTSTLVAKLNAGGSWSTTLSDGTDATVTVNSIDTATDTGTADVSIVVGDPGCTADADCDDADACTTDTCDTGTGTCSNTPINCDDSNACTTDTCNGGTCFNTQISCDDGNACTTDTCDMLTGCANTPVTCPGGDLCNTATCDPAVGCGISPKCPNDGLACNGIETCDANGDCAVVPGTPNTCDDGFFCNGAEVCVEDGAETNGYRCDPGTTVDCDDGDLCTDDACDETNDQCTNTAVTCDDSNLCTTDTCNPATGCSFDPISCDDGVVCTTDTCDPLTGDCVNTQFSPCCGDGICAGNPDEDCNSCPQDCASGTFGGSTPNNGICEVGEDCTNTPNDCPGVTGGKPGNRYCCAGDPSSGITNAVSCDANGQCGGQQCDSTTVQQTYCCGDGTCEGPETYGLCNTADCNAPAPTDAPVPTPAPVFVPTPAPVPVPTPAPVTCGGKNAPCGTDADCCSNTCRGNGSCS